MDRKKSLTTAALVSGAVFAATAAIGLNVGILSSGADENPVGNVTAEDLSPIAATTPSTEPVTVYVDEYVTDPAAGSAATTSESTGAGEQSGQQGDTADENNNDDGRQGPGQEGQIPVPDTTTTVPPVTGPVVDDHEDDDHAEVPDPTEFEGHDDDD